jgi:hypothetical protein
MVVLASIMNMHLASYLWYHWTYMIKFYMIMDLHLDLVESWKFD